MIMNHVARVGEMVENKNILLASTKLRLERMKYVEQQ